MANFRFLTLTDMCVVVLVISDNNIIIPVHNVTENIIFTPQPLRAVGVLFSPMVSGWAGGRASGRAAGNSLSGLYLRNRKV